MSIYDRERPMPSAETRAKMAAAKRGGRASAATKAKIGKSVRAHHRRAGQANGADPSAWVVGEQTALSAAPDRVRRPLAR